MKRFISGFLFLLGLGAITHGASYDSGATAGASGVQNEATANLTVNGNTILGDALGDSVTQNAATVSYPNDTVITLGGGASGLTITGDVILASNTLIDAYSDSFGAVTAGSTSTVTYTEVVDRLSEFVTSSFTVTLAGFYEVNAHSGVSQTAGSACLILKKNAVSLAGGTVCNQGVTGLASVLDVSLTRILSLSAADIIRIDASATTANATFQKMTFTVKRLN